MHLAFLTSEYPHPSVNRAAGIGTSIKNLAEGLVEKNIKISLFIYGQDTNLVFEESGITFHLIKHINYPFLGWLRYRKHIASYINKVAKKEKIDAIEAADWTGITAFMKLSIPLVIRLHGTDAYFCHLEGRSQKKKNRWFEATALKNADAIISVSDYTAKMTTEIFGLKSNITTLYNGIDTNKFKPLHLPKEANTILYFGTIVRKKGVLDLAKAFQILKNENPDATLTLIGKDNVDIFEKRSTLELFNELLDEKYRSSVKHLQHMPYEDVVKEIAKAGVVVLPSRAEAFPMSWLEAMAMEKALVTSNIGWAKELMIADKTGLMVSPDDHQGLAEAILKILNDEKLANEFGINARKRIVDHFSSEIIVDKNIEYYKTLTS
ncbi:glycosyltransferase family 4 protein [Ulvibacter antarcticus]|uniref:Glycosyltransferase involved in cell wall biosynthesis n=1 Tax=Ulvibacter antarcticus TaxID=442714 RepID=A0A3L9YJ79_9FLAO|nr:glycosyltransferase family 4 protein [Ulvibacter antarcticus]RMA57988.1 glycosyltransferase involved in cell wall biosynthesis [Ulvibacter antarcticus]